MARPARSRQEVVALILEESLPGNGGCINYGFRQRTRGGRTFRDHSVVCAEGTLIMPAHRLIYLVANGSITEGMFILHNCDNAWCVNVAHLREGTNQENQFDVSRSSLKPYSDTHCAAGHPWEKLPDGKQGCRKCKNEKERLRYRTKGALVT